MSARTQKFYDVVIVGGGLAGSYMAALLASRPALAKLRVLLLETGARKQLSNRISAATPYSNRVLAVTPANQLSLQDLGCWSERVSSRARAVHRMCVWEKTSAAQIDFHFPPIRPVRPISTTVAVEQPHTLNFIVENDLLQDEIWRRLHGESASSTLLGAQLDIEFNCKLRDITLPDSSNQSSSELPINAAEEENADDLVRVCIESPVRQSINCSLLIGADGANSFVRKRGDFDSLSWKHHQKGIVATLKAEQDEKLEEKEEEKDKQMRIRTQPNEGVAWQRFTPSGVIAYLPLAGQQQQQEYSLVWSTNDETADELMRLDERAFVTRLNTEMLSAALSSPLNLVGGVLRSLAPISLPSSVSDSFSPQKAPRIKEVDANSRALFPLGFHLCVDFVRPRLALIGDAAHRILPLAGLGMNLGLADAALLCDLLEQTVRCGEDLGDIHHLTNYQTERMRYVAAVQSTVELLNSLNQSQWLGAQMMREIAFYTFDKFSPLKEFVMKSAISGKFS